MSVASTARAAVIHRTGGPEVIEWRDLDPDAPYHRSGIYPVEFPSGLGLEAAGVGEAEGDGVAFRRGDRVVTFGPGLGAYFSAQVAPADILFGFPTISMTIPPPRYC